MPRGRSDTSPALASSPAAAARHGAASPAAASVGAGAKAGDARRGWDWVQDVEGCLFCARACVARAARAALLTLLCTAAGRVWSFGATWRSRGWHSYAISTLTLAGYCSSLFVDYCVQRMQSSLIVRRYSTTVAAGLSAEDGGGGAGACHRLPAEAGAARAECVSVSCGHRYAHMPETYRGGARTGEPTSACWVCLQVCSSPDACLPGCAWVERDGWCARLPAILRFSIVDGGH